MYYYNGHLLIKNTCFKFQIVKCQFDSYTNYVSLIIGVI